ncbi:hypothetical protein PARA125_001034 [Parachlamydia sp. AcF125]|nr:hypothetical protein [Parachlamydia sp. AcF125]
MGQVIETDLYGLLSSILFFFYLTTWVHGFNCATCHRKETPPIQAFLLCILIILLPRFRPRLHLVAKQRGIRRAERALSEIKSHIHK